MMFSLGQLSREKFELIFSDTNRPAALKIINDMCRNRRNVNTVNIGALYQLGDKQHLEALFSIFRYQNQQSLINQAIPRLDRMFNLVCSKIGLEGAVKLKAKKGLDNFMHEIFDAGDKYSIDSTNVIKNHLDRSINADQNRGARNIKRAIFNEFFNIKV